MIRKAKACYQAVKAILLDRALSINTPVVLRAEEGELVLRDLTVLTTMRSGHTEIEGDLIAILIIRDRPEEYFGIKEVGNYRVRVAGETKRKGK